MDNSKIYISLITLIIISVVLIPITEAKGGCCSWHGGVCSYSCPEGYIGIGYMCCDGTPLSSKCSPYYSKCVKNECEKGYIDEYRCNENTIERKYQYSDCTVDWGFIEYCDYGCSGGECNPHKPKIESLNITEINNTLPKQPQFHLFSLLYSKLVYILNWFIF